MNFLAHAYLSGGGNSKILVGNLIGDFIKGRQALNKLDAEVVRGVELHRAIDEFTDNHPIVHDSKKRLRPDYRHYAGVIADVFYDHFLATHWNEFHPETLERFSTETYGTLERFSTVLPESFKIMMPYMVRGNWLLSYREVDGVHRALSGMASRTPYQSGMETASRFLRHHYDEFEQEFETFFPQLKAFAQEWIKSIDDFSIDG